MQNKLKIFESKKLHYGKFLYRLSLGNSFAPWFRTEFQKGGSLKVIQEKISQYQEKYDRGEILYRTLYRSDVPIDDKEFTDAKLIYEKLKNSSDYKVRVERWNGLNIYSNDRNFLFTLGSCLRYGAIEFYEPKPDIVDKLLSDKNIIIVDKPPEFELKVTLNYKKVNPALADWLEANTDKSKAGKVTIDNIRSGWASSCYIFLRDERVLMMVQMISGHSIQRIEKLVYKGDIDK